ncbi:hypothetical protein [Natronorarus salvus]|uniref:hypothetical protein n=1 Tax=Natronorarus salvus TaxID=3117733 RepID=UPI002F2655F2
MTSDVDGFVSGVPRREDDARWITLSTIDEIDRHVEISPASSVLLANVHSFDDVHP